MKTMTGAQKKAFDAATRVFDSLIQQALKDVDNAPEFAIVLPFDPEILSQIFTRERLRLWWELYRSKPRSLTELAGRLDRNVSRVRQDVLLLERYHMVQTEKRGNEVRAWTRAPQIIIAPPA